MKLNGSLWLVRLAPVLLLSVNSPAASNVSPSNKFAWCENVGWTNWRDAGSPVGFEGAKLSATGRFFSGYVWGENIGWINLGDGSPGLGSAYANTTGADAGVNVLVSGNLSGLAWGENIGWINFDTAPALGAFGQQARYDGLQHRLRGFAWGESIGWINLDDASAYIAFTPPCSGDINSDGAVNTLDLAIILFYFGQPITPGTNGDFNGDGIVNTNDLAVLLGGFGNTCP